MKKFTLAINVGIGITSLLIFGCSTINKVNSSQVDHDDLSGTWRIEYIEQRPVIDHSPARITFNHNQDSARVSGSASCNNLMASYQLTTDNMKTQLTFGQAAGTMMMCPEVLMEQEQRFLAAMPKVKHVGFENGLLILTDENSNLIFKASKEDK